MLHNVTRLTRTERGALLIKRKAVLKSQRKGNFSMLLWHNIKTTIRKQFSTIRKVLLNPSHANRKTRDDKFWLRVKDSRMWN